MTIGVATSRQRNVGIQSFVSTRGKESSQTAIDNHHHHNHPPSTITTNDDSATNQRKYDKTHRRRRRLRAPSSLSWTRHQAHSVGFVMALVGLFVLFRTISMKRQDRFMRYARAQSLLRDMKESNTRHRDRTTHGGGDENALYDRTNDRVIEGRFQSHRKHDAASTTTTSITKQKNL